MNVVFFPDAATASTTAFVMMIQSWSKFHWLLNVCIAIVSKL